MSPGGPGHRFVPDGAACPTRSLICAFAGTKQVTDFHLVNLAARHEMRLATFDGSLLRSLADADRGHVFVIDA